MSTFALAIGLVVGNILHPGDGLQLDDDVSAAGQEQAAGGHGSTTDFLLGIIPTSMFSSLTSGEVLQTLLVALLVGFALQQMGRAGEPILRGVGHLQRLVFRVLAMIMWAAPVGAFGAIAARGRRDRRRRAEEPGRADVRLLRHLRAVRVRRPRHAAQAGHRRQHLHAAPATSPASSC